MKITKTLTIFILFLGIWGCSENKHLKENKNGTVVLKLGHDMSEQSLRHLALVRFAEILKHKTNNKVVIEIFAHQKLGTDYQMISKGKSGEIDLIFPPTSKITSILPVLKVLDVPFYFDSKQDLYNSLDQYWNNVFNKKLNEHGFTGLHIFEGGFKQIITNRKIKNIKDFKNIKFRVMRSELLKKQYSLLESKPIHIDFHQLGKAFRDKNIDAFENPIDTVHSMKLAPPGTNILLTHHAFLGQYLMISNKSLEKIPSDLRKYLYEASEEAMKYLRKLNSESEKNKIKRLSSLSVNIIYPNKKLINDLKSKWKVLALEFQKDFPDIVKDFKTQDKTENLIIGLDLALTGPSFHSGKGIELGTQIAIEEINSKGGVKGKLLKAISLDNQGFPSKGLANLEKFTSFKELVAVMGGLHSPIALKELDFIHKKKIPFLIPWAAATHIIDNGYQPNFVFRFSVRDELAGKFIIREVQKKYKKVALLLENTGWGKSNQKGLIRAMKEYDIVPTTIQFFNWGQTDLKKELKYVKEKASEVIIFVGNAPEGKVLLESLIKENINIPIVSHWGITGGDFYLENKKNLTKVNLSFLQTYILENSDNKKLTQLISKVQAKAKLYKERMIAPVGIVHSYELVHLLGMALEKSESFSGDDVRKALKEITSYSGLFRDYENPFASNQEALDLQDFSLARFDSNGNIVEVVE